MSATKSIARIVELADGVDPALTPRQALRTAISAHTAAKAELEVLTQTTAYDGEASASVRSAEAAVEAAKAALQASKNGTAVAMVNRALSQPEGVGIPIAEARAELLRAQDELEAAIDAKRYLAGQISAAESRLSGAEWRVDEAVRTVIVHEVLPNAQRIHEEHDRIWKAATEIAQVVSWLRLNKAVGASPFPMVAQNAYDGAAVWREAEKALRVDADYQLPAFPGIGAVVSAKR
jgi:hypothetical protein